MMQMTLSHKDNPYKEIQNSTGGSFFKENLVSSQKEVTVIVALLV